MSPAEPAEPGAESPGSRPARDAGPAPLWQGGWALGVAATAAALLAVFGQIPAAVAGALGLAALPGAIGWIWGPGDRRRLAVLGAWALCVAAAATLTGGATGPLAPWCAAPLLAGLLMGLLPQGAAAATAAVALAGLAEWMGVAIPAPDAAAGAASSAMGLFMLIGGVACAAELLRRDVRGRMERVNAEQAWFEGALAELPYLGIVLDRDGRPEAMFGAAPPGLDTARIAGGLDAIAIAEDQPAIRAALWEALDHGAGESEFRPAGRPELTLRLALRRRGEDGLSALVHSAPAAPAASEDDGRLVGLEQRLAEAEGGRRDAEAAAATKARFLANMSHELRTPLNAIMGFSDIMRARMFGELAPKYGEYAELIHDAGGHLLDLINDVLDMSKIEAERYSLVYETFDARDAVNAAMRLLRLQADEAGIQLRGLLPSQPVMVRADRRAVKQIVLNLVSNALKFTPRDGSVTVTGQARGGEFELVVADTGAGIAPEDLERLGKPYEQAGDVQHRAQGTGLGLSLVQAFARLHGGTMGIESALGEGAAVTVRLPVLVEAAPEDAPAAPEVEADAQSQGQVEAVEAPAAEPPPEPDMPPTTAAAAEPTRFGTVITLPLNRQS